VRQQLELARENLQHCLDPWVQGYIADREGLLLAASKDYKAALEEFCRSLAARLLVGDYDAIKSSCFNIGNVLKQRGTGFYEQAKLRLLLSDDICQWIQLGADNAVQQIVLIEIAIEEGNFEAADSWLKRAKNIIEISKNRLNLADWCYLRACYFKKRYGNPKFREIIVNLLAKARNIYAEVSPSDLPRRAAIIRKNFPEEWITVGSECRQGPGS
jgi:tetratricopeptide (TPR) repeat protein